MKGEASQYCYKASGKVLIAGGYGVLQQGNYGLSLGLNKHYYAICTTIPSSMHSQILQISVASPQIQGKWSYSFDKTEIGIKQKEGPKNAFVEQALIYSLSFCLTKSSVLVYGLRITVLFDRGFLSEPINAPSSQRFINYPPGGTKTGLGSSACVTVAVVGAIIGALQGLEDQKVVNVVSQMANLAAQGKIGSNFDISTAVYGSHLYQNLLPRKVMAKLDAREFDSMLQVDANIKQLKQVEGPLKYFSLWMIDLRKGSDTRKMVGGFVSKLKDLGPQSQKEFYSQSHDYVLKIHHILTQTEKLYINNLKQVNVAYRQFLQKYSDSTGVAVQPLELRPLLNALTELPTTAYAICPGSGGYDAVFLISTQPSSQAQAVKYEIEKVCQQHRVSASAALVQAQWGKSPISEQQRAALRKAHYGHK